MLSKNVCPKCSGNMYVNLDKDLSCLMCGAIIVLTVRRHSDIQGIRKKVDDTPADIWRMGTDGTHRRKGSPRKFLGKR